MKQIVLFLFTLYFASCVPLSLKSATQFLSNSPPRFVEATTANEKTISLRFDKACQQEKILFSNGLTVENITSPEEGVISITTKEIHEPGKEYVVELTVVDAKGNTTTLLWAFYGFNSRLPEIQLNEISVNGSTTRPDMVELLCLSAGNLAGLALYNGSPSDFKNLFVFPNVEVKKNEMIIVHFKPEGLPEEIQETGALDASGGRQAHPKARDFWVEGGSGLTGTNGALTLYNTPGGKLIEAFLYSNRTSASDTTYNGFGNNTFLTNVTEITEQGGWQWPEETPRPQDCFNPEKVTSTRTINRRPNTPKGHQSSWFIGASGTVSFGEPNTNEVYSP